MCIRDSTIRLNIDFINEVGHKIVVEIAKQPNLYVNQIKSITVNKLKKNSNFLQSPERK